jgi:hypothetical protein
VVFIIFNGGMVGGCGAVLRIGECRITLYELVSSYFFFFCWLVFMRECETIGVLT